MRLQPERSGRDSRINPCLVPPSGFVAAAVEFAMMATAERHGELIADLAAERAALGEAKVVRIGRRTAADQAWLFGNKSDVIPIADSARFWKRQNRLIDTPLARHIDCFTRLLSSLRASRFPRRPFFRCARITDRRFQR